MALLAGACGSPEGDEASDLVDRSLAASDERAATRVSARAYTLFEADPVRPIAVLESSGLVAVTNTIDGYLEILRPSGGSAAPCGAVQVGLQPVAVAVVEETASSAELWVVNHLSDSVSVIALDTQACRGEVTRTLQVGDEPRDIVVARDSAGRARVFVATAHRGQNHPEESARLGTDLIFPPRQKSLPGLADVMVFDPAALGAAPAVVNVFGDRPRALAVADGVVYAATFLSGNRTTLIPTETVSARGLASLDGVLARDEAGALIEEDGELVLKAEARGVASIEGGLPAVAGRGRCFPDPRDEDATVGLQRLCVQTDGQNRAHPGWRRRSRCCADGVEWAGEALAARSRRLRHPGGRSGGDEELLRGGHRALRSGRAAWHRQGVRDEHRGQQPDPLRRPRSERELHADRPPAREPHHRARSGTRAGRRRRAARAPQHARRLSHCCEKDVEENAKSFAFPTAGVFSRGGDRFFFSALGSDKIGSVNAEALASGFDHDAARERDDLRDIFLNDDMTAPSGPVGVALDAGRGRLYVKTHRRTATRRAPAVTCSAISTAWRGIWATRTRPR